MTVVTQRTGPHVQVWDLDAQVYQELDADVVTLTRPFTQQEIDTFTAEAQGLVRAQRLTDATTRLRQAFAINKTYLDKVAAGTAVNADHLAQVVVLTRELQGLIKLVAVTTLSQENDLDPLPTSLDPPP